MHIYILYIIIHVYVDKLREIFQGRVSFSIGVDSVMIAKEHVAYTYFCQYLEDCFKGIYIPFVFILYRGIGTGLGSA